LKTIFFAGGENMGVDSGSDSTEIIDDMSNDLADQGLGRRRANTCAPNRSPFSKIILGVGIVILALLVVLVFRGGNNVSKEEFKSLSSRLDQIERRLASSEAAEKKISSFESQFQTLNQSLARLDGADRTLRERIDKLAQQMEKLATPPGPAPKATTSPHSQKSTPAKSTSRYHEVAPGETLFQIAGKYGMSVEDLRRLNKIKQGQTLQPGQKLLISTGH
jgi:LysM domain